MKVHVGSVFHKHGTNIYVSRTFAGLQKQIAGFCLEWWSDAELPEAEDGTPKSEGMSDEQIIGAYFDVMGERDESYDVSTVELGD